MTFCDSLQRRYVKAGALLGVALLVCCGASSPVRVAQTPPMGWNSWDAYGTTVSEAEVKANADYMAQRLKRYGWRYVVVDIQWSEPEPRAHGYRPNANLQMDVNGRLIPAQNRFPSAAGGQGFTELASYVHQRGLLFGIHIMRGIPRRAVDANLPVLGSNVRAADIADRNSTCRWNTDMFGIDMSKPGAQAYYDSIVKLYSGWGVDYIKADDMAHPLHESEITALHLAMEKSGRPIVLSLSPGPADIKKTEFYAANANMWRIDDDFWDRWPDLKRSFGLQADWAPYRQPGAWPDADMLPLGRVGIRAERGEDRTTRFTPEEQRTLMTLWSIGRSPLMFGGDLPSNDSATLELITNNEVLDVNQSGSDARQLRRDNDTVVWISNARGGKAKNVAVFNIGDEREAEIRVTWKELGLGHRATVRDLWEHRNLGRFDEGYTFPIRPHASGLYRVQ